MNLTAIVGVLIFLSNDVQSCKYQINVEFENVIYFLIQGVLDIDSGTLSNNLMCLHLFFAK